MFKSNEGFIEELEKVLVAHEYYETERFLNSSDEKQREVAERLRRID